MPFKNKDDLKLYKQANKTVINEKLRTWYYKNREKVLAQKKAKREANKKPLKNKNCTISGMARVMVFRRILKDAQMSIEHGTIIYLINKGIAYERRKVWKQLRHDLEWRYWLKTA